MTGENFISPSLEIELEFYAHISDIRRRAEFQPRIAHRMPVFITAPTLIAAGYGIALVPESIRCIRLPGATYRHLLEPLDPGSFAAVFRHDETALATQHLIRMLQEITTGASFRLQLPVTPRHNINARIVARYDMGK